MDKKQTKKSFKSLFSKSEANLTGSGAESGASGAEKKPSTDKKRFKFPGVKLKTKSSGDRASGPLQQSVAQLGLNDSSDNVSVGTDRTSMYATAPRSKGKELSMSEIDLSSKPKRFSTLSLGLRRKKKKEGKGLSQSTFGLDGSGIEVQPEKPSNLGKTMSRSQPELDTSEIFDIPSPPPVAVNQPEFPLPQKSETPVTVHSVPVQPQPAQSITLDAPNAPIATIPELNLGGNLEAGTQDTHDASDYKVDVASSKVEKPRSGFAMPKLDNNTQGFDTKLEIPIGQKVPRPEKDLGIKAGSNDLKLSTITGDEPIIDPSLSFNPKKEVAEEKPSPISSSLAIDPKMATVRVPPSSSLGKQYTFDSKAETSAHYIKSTVDPAAPNLNAVQNFNESKMAGQDDPKTGIMIEDKQPVINNTFTVDPKMASTKLDAQTQEFSSTSKPATSTISSIVIKDELPVIDKTFDVDPKMAATNLEKQVETVNIVSTRESEKHDSASPERTSICSSENVYVNDGVLSKISTFSNQSKMADQDKLFGELYDSLFPEKFTQEVISSLLNTSSKSNSEYKSPRTTSETVLVTRFESERSSTPLSTSSQRIIGDTSSAFSQNNLNDVFAETSSNSSIDSSKPVYIRKVTTYDVTSSSNTKTAPADGKFAYSEFSTESKYATRQPHVTVEPSNYTYTPKSPPLFNYAPSQETSAQVSAADSKRKVVLVKELVSDEAQKDSGCPTPAMEGMSAVTPSSEVKSDAFEAVSVTSGQTELLDGICSPAYLSVGSDDGSTMEIFFSAEEDNSDDLFTPEVTVIHAKSTSDEHPAANRTMVLRDDADLSVSSGGDKMFESGLQKPVRVDMQVQSGSRMSEEKRESPQVMKAENESKVEFLAAPVEPAKEFQVVSPFSEEMGSKEGQGVSQTEFKVAPDRNTENKLGGDVRDSGPVLGCPSRFESKWQITPKFAGEAEQVLSSGRAEGGSEVLEEILDTGGDNRATVSERVTDTVTESRAGRSSVQQVDLAAQGQNSSAAALQIQEILDQNQGTYRDRGGDQEPALRQGSLPQFPPLQQTSADAGGMSSSFSRLSTTLSLRGGVPSQSDEGYRFRKVSLVSEGEDRVDMGGTGEVTGSKVMQTNGLDSGGSEEVIQFRPQSDSHMTPQGLNTEYLLRSTTSFTSDSSAAALPEDASSPDGGGWNSGRGLNDNGRGLFDTGCGLSDTGAGLVSVAPAPERREAEADSVGSQREEDTFSGVFKATLVDLVPESPAPAQTADDRGQFNNALVVQTPPGSPDETDDSPSQFDMDSLVDTLKNMGPSLRMRSLSARGPQSSLLTSSSLPPIVEDAPGSLLLHKNKAETDGFNGIYTLPPDIGLKKSSFRDMRSPLELMKLTKEQNSRPLRASASNSIVMRTSSDSSSQEEQPSSVPLNGSTGSRLDHSLIFSSLRSSSVDQASENGIKSHRSLFRASSLPDVGLSNDRMSLPPKDISEVDSVAPRFDRFSSFLLNSASSVPSGGSLTGAEDYASRISRTPLSPLSVSLGSPPSGNSPTLMLSPTGSLELNRTLLQRSLSGDSGVSLQQVAPQPFNVVQNFQNHFQAQEPEPEPERNLLSKYRAFPDAYLTKEKEHGKLNPRPGKMYIFDQPGMCGQRIEIRSDLTDATAWELGETISIRVIRGGWVLYEKPNFKGEKIALDEGELELTSPFSPVEGEEAQTNGQTEGAPTNGEQGGENQPETPTRRFTIGSIRRAVRDYSVPEISLFPEQNAEGKKVVFRDSSEDARIFGFPIKANSIVINAGLWLVYAQPFFQGVPRVLEVGGYTNPEAWGVEQPYVASLHPLKIGEPRVENMNEPKMVVFDKPYFCGKSRTVTRDSRDFMGRSERQQQAFMHNVGSLKVMGGIWVGYEKEGFRGNQYLLEEGDYQDWRVWGGVDAELRSVRLIRAELNDPLLVMFEQPEEEQEEQEENTFEVTEAIPDVELFEFKTSTRSIQVFSGAWVAYSHVDFSGSQYILEKGFYSSYADWGSLDSRICSLQPILPVPRDDSKNRSQVMLYTEPDFQGQCHIIDRNQEALSDKLLPKSCRVTGGSWVLFENKQFQGNQYVLSEGDYPNLLSMGCPASSYLRSVKAVPMMLSVPSISLFGLECLEGREISTETEMFSLVEEGYNNHILSVRVNSGSWVLCEFSNYRGRQFLLEPIEITNWPKFSSMPTIGSMYPVRQKRSLFRVKNADLGQYLSVQGGVEEMKSGRVVVTPEAEPMSDMWYYQDGLVKNKLSPTMCLQVMGNVEPAAKVVLWTETRQPVQTWTAQMRGLISSLTFPGMVLDVKGGKTYDKDHVVLMPEDEDRPSQRWQIEML